MDLERLVTLAPSNLIEHTCLSMKVSGTACCIACVVISDTIVRLIQVCSSITTRLLDLWARRSKD